MFKIIAKGTDADKRDRVSNFGASPVSTNVSMISSFKETPSYNKRQSCCENSQTKELTTAIKNFEHNDSTKKEQTADYVREKLLEKFKEVYNSPPSRKSSADPSRNRTVNMGATIANGRTVAGTPKQGRNQALSSTRSTQNKTSIPSMNPMDSVKRNECTPKTALYNKSFRDTNCSEQTPSSKPKNKPRQIHITLNDIDDQTEEEYGCNFII